MGRSDGLPEMELTKIHDLLLHGDGRERLGATCHLELESGPEAVAALASHLFREADEWIFGLVLDSVRNKGYLDSGLLSDLYPRLSSAELRLCYWLDLATWPLKLAEDVICAGLSDPDWFVRLATCKYLVSIGRAGEIRSHLKRVKDAMGPYIWSEIPPSARPMKWFDMVVHRKVAVRLLNRLYVNAASPPKGFCVRRRTFGSRRSIGEVALGSSESSVSSPNDSSLEPLSGCPVGEGSHSITRKGKYLSKQLVTHLRMLEEINPQGDVHSRLVESAKSQAEQTERSKSILLLGLVGFRSATQLIIDFIRRWDDNPVSEEFPFIQNCCSALAYLVFEGSHALLKSIALGGKTDDLRVDAIEKLAMRRSSSTWALSGRS